jgi:hypothetical protein
MTRQARKQIELWNATTERYIWKVAARVTSGSFGRAAILWAAQMKVVVISGDLATDWWNLSKQFDRLCEYYHERQTTRKASDESKTQTNTTAA